MTMQPAGQTGERDRQFASTLARGIDILLAYRPGEALLGNADFARRAGLSKSTVARLTHTLCALGYLRHDAALGKYRLGAAVVSMGYPLLAGMQVRQIARPLMKALADHVGGAVSLGMRERTRMIYVETARSTDSLVVTPDIGAALPMLATAIGRAWLARAPAAERTAVLNRLRLEDPEMFRRLAPAAERARQDFARRGYCINRGEWRDEVYGFAVPLLQPVDAQLLVLNCGVPARAGSFAAVEKDVAPRLVTLVQTVEGLLGMR